MVEGPHGKHEKDHGEYLGAKIGPWPTVSKEMRASVLQP